MTEQAIYYGDALYELARSEGLSGKILCDLQKLSEVFLETPDYLVLMSEPSIPASERCGLLDRAFREEVHLYTLNFLKILTERTLIRHFSECFRRFRERYNEDNGMVEAAVSSAVQLTDEQKERLLQKLQKITGKKISLICTVDPGLIGGIRLSVDNREFDGTIRGHLSALTRILKETTV